MTAENEYDDAARAFFLDQLTAGQEAAAEVDAESAMGTDLDDETAWTVGLSPEELDRASMDGVYGEKLYQRWKARQRAAAAEPARPTPTVGPPPLEALSDGARAFMDGRAELRELPRSAQDEVVERMVGPASSRAVAAYEQGSEVTLTANEQVEAVDRSFRRRGARDRAERGLRW